MVSSGRRQVRERNGVRIGPGRGICRRRTRAGLQVKAVTGRAIFNTRLVQLLVCVPANGNGLENRLVSAWDAELAFSKIKSTYNLDR